MKMQTTAGQLCSALSAFKGIVHSRNSLPVLGTVKFDGGRLVGTDLDTEVSISIATIGEMEGATCIDWQSLYDLSCSIGTREAVSLSYREETSAAVAVFNGSEYQMAALEASEFPEFKAAKGPKSDTGDLGLVAAFNRVQAAISTEDTRYYLNGVALLKDPSGQAVVVATNGHRLALMPVAFAPEGSIGAIIPRQLVHYLCQRKIEPTSCIFDKERVRATFEFPGMTIKAKMIDGTFPDVFRVVPSDIAPVFSAERKALLAVLLRMRRFLKARGLPVKLSIADNLLTLSVRAGAMRATEQLDVDGGGSQPREAGFNIDYLISVLSIVRGDRVQFESDDAFGSSPTVVTGDGDKLFQLLMPMRV